MRNSEWLPDLAALLGVLLVLAAFSVTGAWIPLAMEWAALAVLFRLRPRLGLPLVVFSIPFTYAIRRIGPAEVSANDLLLFAATAGWVLRRLATHRDRGFRRSIGHTGQPAEASGPPVEPPPALSPQPASPQLAGWRRRLTGIDRAVGFFLLVCLVSVFVGEDKRSALWELRILALQPVLLYLLVRSEPLSGKELLRLGDALVLGAVALAAIGLHHFLVLDYVEAAEGVRRLLIPFYDSPNHIGLFLGRAIPVALALAVYGRGRARRLLHGLALAAMLLASYLTFSRGAWLVGLPAASLFVLLLPQLRGGRRSRRVLLVAAGAVALGLLALLPVARTERFASLAHLEGGTSFLRLVLWKGALRMIAAHPVLGVGIGNFATQYPGFMLPEAWREPLVYHPHNLLLDTWAILGLPGLAALAWLQVAFWRTGLSAYRRLVEPALQALMLGLMGGMVSFLAHGLVDTAYFLADLALVFTLTLALTVRLRSPELREAVPLEHNSRIVS
jgi:O-antigen ligase